MTKIFIPYGTTEGQTARIAQYIADVIRTHGHEAEPVNITQSSDTLPDGYDGVIVGAAIHMGKHDKHIVEYLRRTATNLRGSRLRSSPSVSRPMVTPRKRRDTSSSSSVRRHGALERSVSLVVPSCIRSTGS